MTSPEADLRPLPVGLIKGRFHVPSYQRGYRWGRLEVRRLLDDLWDNRDQPYYLQPVVVQQRTEGVWDLVDGQQRLTTLYLLRRYMAREQLQNDTPQYSLTYETRPESGGYLQDPDPSLAQRNIDFFHIHEAYASIEEWFAQRDDRRQFVANKLYNAMFETVKVIWYEVSGSADANTLFTRLNVGRIPLTDAELVKALLLSRVSRAHSADRARELAGQWDDVEKTLRRSEVWAFVSGRPPEDGTRIDLLLDTLAGGPTGRERPRFETFERLRTTIEDNPERFWNEVLDLHSTVLDWYENRNLFHKVGFLIADGLGFVDLVAAAQGQRKSAFDAYLDETIRTRLGLSEADVRDLDYHSRYTPRVLLLMNVETMRSRSHTGERYPFAAHAAGHWSMEHIHAQNAERLTRAEQWAAWLKFQRDALRIAPGVGERERAALLSETEAVLATQPDLRGADFRALEQRYVRALSLSDEQSDPDAIANLALLHAWDNVALSNSTFAVKRAKVIELDEAGAHIPVCTRNVFLKYYSPLDALQMHFWSSTDRRFYLDRIVRTLRPYLRADLPEQSVEATA